VKPVAPERVRVRPEGPAESTLASGVGFMVSLLSVKADSILQSARNPNGNNDEMDSSTKAQHELERIEKQIADLEAAAGENQDARRQLRNLQDQVEQLRTQMFAHLRAWKKTELARHPQRPYTLDYVERIFTDWSEVHGDRNFGDDHAIVCGMARFFGEEVMVIGHQKGRDTKQNVYRNWSMPNPEGYRKALRFMRFAEKFGRPIFTLVDTLGAYPGLGAEERGQAEAIARNLREMVRIEVPIITAVIGEGGSGGALAIAVADRVLMMENSIYSVISPEGCASIMWRDRTKRELAAEALRITPEDLSNLGVIDGVVAEPEGGAHTDHESAAALLAESLKKNLDAVKKLSVPALLDARYNKFRKMAQFFTE
jgi:acetyl-CoA carboxylase carboxyl transferase subunit alpha